MFTVITQWSNSAVSVTVSDLFNHRLVLSVSLSPQAPPPPEKSWDEMPSSVSHLGAEDFREFLKKKKHALVMFYAPCKPSVLSEILQLASVSKHISRLFINLLALQENESEFCCILLKHDVWLQLYRALKCAGGVTSAKWHNRFLHIAITIFKIFTIGHNS